MTRTSDNSWLRGFAVVTAVATLVLICIGGVVTSKGVGMAVPDWPTTYGYNMFFFPFSQWVGGIFYEHTHRLVASGVGLLTTILALWLFGRKSRPLIRWIGGALLVAGIATAMLLPARMHDAMFLGLVGIVSFGASFFWPSGEPTAPWLRRLGVIAFVAVVLQGVLGGLRVTEMKDEIGIFHATLAQLFFTLTCAIALFTSRWWENLSGGNLATIGKGWRMFVPLVTALVLVQLVLGATMRHQHAGLAVPDFPLAYGQLWPAMDAESVAKYNQDRIEATVHRPITAFQIGLHMTHRLAALAILIAVTCAAWLTRRRLGMKNPLTRLSLAWFCLILIQAALGVMTVLTNKAADIATAHVAVGALALVAGSFLSIMSFRLSASVPAGTAAFAPAKGDEAVILSAASAAGGHLRS
jgi:cytochrome c oxidase assembly protein subunit 15